MTWGARFRWYQGVLEGLWGIPVLGAILGGALGLVVSIADEHVATPAFWHYSPSTATAVVAAIISSAAALTGFVVTVTVLVVQMAMGTFSARIMRLWYHDPLLKVTLAILLGTVTFSFALLRRIDDDFVPDLGVTLAGLLMSICLVVFVVFFDRCVRRLRPVAVAADVARAARSTFTQNVRTADRTDIRWEFGTNRAADPTLIVRATHGGAIQAVDADGFVGWARAHGAELFLPHPVGDFVHTVGAVVLVYGGAFGPNAAADLEGMIAFGDERTYDQDPAFALRILVDIANRALSPAVNDPTTAVQVLDHIGEVLSYIGMTDLDQRTRPETGTRASVVMVARRWEDFVTLGLTEIREFGVDSVQVVRRLRGLLEDLVDTVRVEHRPAVEEELRRVDAATTAGWRDSVDLDRASQPDRQGIGGPASAPLGQE